MQRSTAAEARRQSLLVVGKRLFAERAYDDVSTDDIAAAADISAGLLYHHFGSKKGFYVATIRAAAAEVLGKTVFPAGVPFGPAAIAALSGFLDFVEANRGLYVGLMRGGVGADAEVHAIVENVRTTLLDRVLLAGGVPAPIPGSAPGSGELRLRLYGWLGMVEFSTLRWLSHGEVSRDELLAILLAAAPAELVANLGSEPPNLRSPESKESA